MSSNQPEFTVAPLAEPETLQDWPTPNSTIPQPTAVPDDPNALGITLMQALLIYILGVGLYVAIRSFAPKLHTAVFAPRSPTPCGATVFPGILGPLRESMATCKAVTDDLAAGAEAAMSLRYISLNLRLLIGASVISLLLMPVYAMSPEARLPASCNCTSWNMLQTLNLNHVPLDDEGDGRRFCAGVACLAYAIVYVQVLKREYTAYAKAMQQWTSADGVEHATLLISVESAHTIRPDEVKEIFDALTDNLHTQSADAPDAPSQVVEVLSLRQLQLGDAQLPTVVSPPADAASALTLHVDSEGEDGDVTGGSTTSAFGCSPKQLRLFMRQLLSEDLRAEARFLVLVRQRRVASMLRGDWAHTLGDHRALLKVKQAPPPLDVYWANLFKSRWVGRTRSLAGMTATSLLFLFWTIPVTFVTTLASLDTLSKINELEWLKIFLDAQGPKFVAQVQTQLSSLLLVSMRFLTISSGLFQVLVKLQGVTSHTDITRMTASAPPHAHPYPPPTPQPRPPPSPHRHARPSVSLLTHVLQAA